MIIFTASIVTVSDKAPLPVFTSNMARLVAQCSIFCLLFITFCSAAAVTAEEQAAEWFQIEYVIFSPVNIDPSVLRFADKHYSPAKKDQYNHLVSSFQPLTDFHHTLLDTNTMFLAGALRRLEKDKSITVLSHGVWQQEIKPETTLAPFLIKKTLPVTEPGNNYQETLLNGTLTIKRARYLHADADLYLGNFLYFPEKDLIQWLLTDSFEARPFSSIVQALRTEEASLMKEYSSAVPSKLIRMQQTRRLKYGEVHYLDHPGLGLIITINKIETPFECCSNLDNRQSP